MAAGGYTAYQYYEDSQYQEAAGATVQPYVDKAYHCPQSQRGGLAASYDSYQQRTQFDAANTSCCSEPVQTFGVKTQYSLVTSPPKSKDCIAKAKIGQRCDHLVIVNPTYKSGCNAAGMVSYAKVQCPNLIRELAGKTKGKIDGDYGTWEIKGMYNPRTMKLTYSPSAALITYAYQHCQSQTYQDTLGKIRVTWKAQAGLDSPGGCYCDCCNVNGHFIYPTHTLTASNLTATWENSYAIPGTVVLNTACKNGSMYGTYNMNISGMSGYITWSLGPSYYSNGSTHYWSGAPSTVLGDSTHPACCGGSVAYYTTDGCGHNDYLTKILARKPGSPSLTPFYQTLYTGTPYTALVTGVCNKSGLAAITLSYSGLNNTQGSLITGTEGQISKSMGTLAFQNFFANKGCCGNGSVSVTYWNDGCNQTGNRAWPVRNHASSSSLKTGSIYQIWWDGGQYYYVRRASMGCAGTVISSWENVVAFANPDLAKAYIDSASDSQIVNDAQNINYVPYPNQCVRYANNGQSGINFQACLFSVNNTGWASSPICCHIPFTSSVAWVYQNSNYCCGGS